MTAIEKITKEKFNRLKEEYISLNPTFKELLGEEEIEDYVFEGGVFRVLIPTTDIRASSDELTKMWFNMSKKAKKTQLAKVYQGLSTFLHTLDINK